AEGEAHGLGGRGASGVLRRRERGAAGMTVAEATLASVEEARLAASRRYCARLTRLAAKNFYYGLKLLPEPKRSAMFALYAYMRLVDDIADDDADGRTVDRRLADLEAWRMQTHAAIAGELPAECHAIWPAFAEVCRR